MCHRELKETPGFQELTWSEFLGLGQGVFFFINGLLDKYLLHLPFSLVKLLPSSYSKKMLSPTAPALISSNCKNLKILFKNPQERRLDPFSCDHESRQTILN